MKKIISLILVIAIFMSMTSGLSGCSSQNVPLEMGMWLNMIADAFGMQEYTSKEPYFSGVDEQNPYFDAFQLAAEWEIIDVDNAINSHTHVSWKDALVSLVNAGTFTRLDASEDEKVQYAMDHFGVEVRSYWLKRDVSLSDVLPALEKAQELWADRVFTERIEEVKLADNVADWTQEKNLQYAQEGNVIMMDAAKLEELQAGGLQEGDIYALPAIAGVSESSINKVESVEVVDGVAIITNAPASPDIEELACVEELRIQETEQLDFSDIAAIYDADGNAVYSVAEGINTANTSAFFEDDNIYLDNLVARSDDAQKAQNTLDIGKASGDFSFTVKDFKVKLAVKGTEVKVGVEYSQSGDDAKGWFQTKDNKYRDEKSVLYGELSFKDFDVTKDIDFSWGKLRSATFKVDYKTSFTVGAKYEQTNKAGQYAEEGKLGNGRVSLADAKSIVRMFAQSSKDLRDTRYNDKEVYICRIALIGDGVANGLDFIITAKLTWSGEIKLNFSLAGSKGVEYRNGNIRYINSKDPTISLAAEGKVSLTAGAGFQLRLFTKTIAEVTINGGAGFSASFKWHLLDAEFHQLATGSANMTMDGANEISEMGYLTSPEDIKAAAEAAGGTWKNEQKLTEVKLLQRACFEWSMYPDVHIEGSIPLLKLKGSYEISGPKNTKWIIKGHLDIPDSYNNFLSAINSGETGQGIKELLGVGHSCSYEFKPWDDAEEELVEIESSVGIDFENDNNTIKVADHIMLSETKVIVDKGQSHDITVTALPEGYRPGDLVAKSDNPKIAQMEVVSGKIFAYDEVGNATITVSTKDGKYQVQCAVQVVDPTPVTFSGINVPT